MGSHLDTQPTGGKFDGVLGVLGALEVVRSLNDLKIKTKHPIEVANWTNEEGSRFAPAMVSSGVFAGVYTKDFAYACEDQEGKKLGEELDAHRLQGGRTGRESARSMPFSSCTSSKARSSRPRTSRSASSPMARASAGTRST